MTKRTVLSVLQGIYDKDEIVSQLKEKGIDTVLRYTRKGASTGLPSSTTARDAC